MQCAVVRGSADLTDAGIAEGGGAPFRCLTFLTYAYPMKLASIVIPLTGEETEIVYGRMMSVSPKIVAQAKKIYQVN